MNKTQTLIYKTITSKKSLIGLARRLANKSNLEQENAKACVKLYEKYPVQIKEYTFAFYRTLYFKCYPLTPRDSSSLNLNKSIDQIKEDDLKTFESHEKIIEELSKFHASPKLRDIYLCNFLTDLSQEAELFKIIVDDLSLNNDEITELLTYIKRKYTESIRLAESFVPHYMSSLEYYQLIRKNKVRPSLLSLKHLLNNGLNPNHIVDPPFTIFHEYAFSRSSGDENAHINLLIDNGADMFARMKTSFVVKYCDGYHERMLISDKMFSQINSQIPVDANILNILRHFYSYIHLVSYH